MKLNPDTVFNCCAESLVTSINMTTWSTEIEYMPDYSTTEMGHLINLYTQIHAHKFSRKRKKTDITCCSDKINMEEQKPVSFTNEHKLILSSGSSTDSYTLDAQKHLCQTPSHTITHPVN